MHIVWLDAFHGGSHAAVAQGFAKHSRHRVSCVALPIDGGWRWRMRGAAVTFARMLREQPELCTADLIVATDMLDLATFLGLMRDRLAHTPIALYLHENQLTYPLPPGRKRDLAFPWINYTAVLAADAIFFNSEFHRNVFLQALPALPGRFHDYHELALLAVIAHKAAILYPGLELHTFHRSAVSRHHSGHIPTLLWNSRWEYDKAPEAFFMALQQLEQRQIDFRVIVAGEHIDPNEPHFVAAREWLAPRCLWWGYAPDATAYQTLLQQADIVVSTAVQEFFGIAVLEALAAGCIPVLPRRLSYPEIIPSELHATCLYDDQSSLVERLITTIQNLERIRQYNMRAIATRFSWEQQAVYYDTAFERVVANYRYH
jgi:glycosyltransferase involved in cell wall biosynthesis